MCFAGGAVSSLRLLVLDGMARFVGFFVGTAALVESVAVGAVSLGFLCGHPGFFLAGSGSTSARAGLGSTLARAG